MKKLMLCAVLMLAGPCVNDPKGPNPKGPAAIAMES